MSSPNAIPKPFVISVPDAQLAALRTRLASTRLFAKEEEPNSNDGDSTGRSEDSRDVRSLLNRWINGYDWRKHEREINEQLPQFTVDITLGNGDTLNIHFVHKRSNVENAIPLLFVHGWPGSFLEVSKILPILTGSGNTFPSFHVVAISLPGFAFSEGLKFRDLSGKVHAEVSHKLMLLLGYTQYVTQGGGWGYIITRRIAQLYGGRHCRATHSNMSIGKPPFRNLILLIKYGFTLLTWEELHEITIAFWRPTTYFSFFELKGTQPPTIGYALADSPVALLAWIYEKLEDWSCSYPWTDDEILTWVSIYWFSRAGPADSLRIFFETMKPKESTRAALRTPRSVAVGVTRFTKREHTFAPKIWTEMVSPNLVFWNTHDRGGHFAAYEQPKRLAQDLRLMFKRGGPAFGVVKGRTGYRESPVVSSPPEVQGSSSRG